MFLSALQTYAVITIIAVVAVQYAFALFCLVKLAFLDITKKQYVLWNLFILLVFFIGGAAFLVYYHKVKDSKRIPPYEPKDAATDTETSNADGEVEAADKTYDLDTPEAAETPDDNNSENA